MTTTQGSEPLPRQAPDERPYVSRPCYAPAGEVRRGWAAAVATLPRRMRTLAVDGPAAAHWDQIAATPAAELTARGMAARIQLVDMRATGLPWSEIEARTRSAALGDDPDFEKLAVGSLADLIDSERIPTDPVPDATMRLAEQTFGAGGRNLLAPPGIPATTKRLFYVDWPLLDRHRDLHGPDIELWLGTRNLTDPTWMTDRRRRIPYRRQPRLGVGHRDSRPVRLRRRHRPLPERRKVREPQRHRWQQP